MLLQLTVILKLVIATGMATCFSMSRRTNLNPNMAQLVMAEDWRDKMQLLKARGMSALDKSYVQAHIS